MSVLSFVMEPGRVETKEEYGEGRGAEGYERGGREEGQYEGEEYGGGREYARPQYEDESVGQGQSGDQYGSQYEGGYTYEGEGHHEGTGQPMQGTQRKLRKPRQPYTVTCALCKTNWFESLMEWENADFHGVYR
ncbi:hypothetical protein FRC10_002850, partial [Ceratobasidium sp. 414]